ncbi:MAG: VCBS repeat-containing protein [Xanthomonadales bacterium]|nr:VCBS repeat-containing protein [Xanthomonadales bacterium]
MQRLVARLVLLSAVAAIPAGVLAAPLACRPNSNPACHPGFPVEFSGPGIPADVGFVQFSSPVVARLGVVGDSLQDIIVGTTGGYVIAYHANGTFLWARRTGGVAIQSKPAVADIDGDGRLEVVVTAGSPSGNGGGMYVLRRDGSLKCSHELPATTQGFYGSPAVGRLDRTRPTQMQIVVGGFDHSIRAFHADCSEWWKKGVADDVIDTVWSSAALFDLDRDGQLDVIIGQDSGQGTLPNGMQVGGQLRAFRGNGVGELPGFPKKLQDVIYSSPAIGDIPGYGRPAIATGYGHCWDMPGCAPHGNWHVVTDEAVYAWSASGAPLPGWPYATPGEASRTNSPALADLDGDGTLETIIGTLDKATSPAVDEFGNVHVIRSNGTPFPGWPQKTWIARTCSTNVQWLDFAASPIVADITGDGIPEIIAVAADYVMVWDRNGNQLHRIAPDVCAGSPNPAHFQMQAWSAIHSTPTVADLYGDGRISLVVGSRSTSGLGALYVWTFAGTSATLANLPWPEFRHDARNTGVHRGEVIFRNGFQTSG